MIAKVEQLTATHSNTIRSRRRIGMAAWLLGLHAIWTERRALARMDASRLSDIGVSRAQAEREARRPAWDAPDRWLR